MAQISPGREVLEMALQLERHGEGFYNHLATSSQGNNETYRDLAWSEREHAQVIDGIIGRLQLESPPILPWDYYDRMNSLAEKVTPLIDDIRDFLGRGTVDLSRAFEIGVILEKEMIFLYATISSLAPFVEPEIPHRLCHEEVRHLKGLRTMAHEGQVEDRFGTRTATHVGPTAVYGKRL